VAVLQSESLEGSWPHMPERLSDLS